MAAILQNLVVSSTNPVGKSNNFLLNNEILDLLFTSSSNRPIENQTLTEIIKYLTQKYSQFEYTFYKNNIYLQQKQNVLSEIGKLNVSVTCNE